MQLRCFNKRINYSLAAMFMTKSPCVAPVYRFGPNALTCTVVGPYETPENDPVRGDRTGFYLAQLDLFHRVMYGLPVK